MAFGFFRRHQKKVIIVMAALMILFLVGLKGMEMLLSEDRSDIPRGETRYGKVTLADTIVAETDLFLLRSYVRLDNPMRMMQWPGSNGMELIQLLSNRDRENLTYALLLAEAAGMGVSVSDADVQTFLSRIGLEGAGYDVMLSSLRAAERGMTEQRLRAAVADWLMIFRAFEAAQVGNPPSVPELQMLYRDLGEMIELRMLRIPADDFLKDVAEGPVDGIVERFVQFKDNPPGKFSLENPFGFGYRQPNRVRVQYLFVSRDGGQTWAMEPDFERGLPNRNVYSLDFDRQGHRLFALTCSSLWVGEIVANP